MNMGAWAFLQSQLNDLLASVLGDRCADWLYRGRPASASPATGSAKVHQAEQERLIEEVLAGE